MTLATADTAYVNWMTGEAVGTCDELKMLLYDVASRRTAWHYVGTCQTSAVLRALFLVLEHITVNNTVVKRNSSTITERRETLNNQDQL